MAAPTKAAKNASLISNFLDMFSLIFNTFLLSGANIPNSTRFPNRKLLNLRPLFQSRSFMQQVFVYGSLLFPELVEALTGRSFESREATLKNYRRFCVQGADFPAVFPQKGSEVHGRILLNVDKQSLDVLNFYEGDEYACRSEIVETENGSAEALVYVWQSGREHLNGDWNEKHFEEKWLRDYIDFIAPETVKAFENLRP